MTMTPDITGKKSVRSVHAGDRVRFVLDGEIMELSDVDPTRTVLQFLREDLHRVGTKEGCAEGDCGACTVVVAQAGEDGAPQARAVNSCIQFLPTLDGKELITVESLRCQDGRLHPVQQALVDCHGSQCGFCTPGFVMSLFALYKNSAAPDRVAIDDALAGNLCRCTGYRPIIAAAGDMYRLGATAGVPADWLHAACGAEVDDDDVRKRVDRLKAVERSETLVLQAGDKRFFAPRSVREMARLVEEFPEAVILAGGTDVGLWVTKSLRELTTVIYSGNVAELRKVSASPSHLEIGSAVTLTDAMPVLLEHYPELEELLRRFASPPIRNAATLGGNIMNGSPIGDAMPALLALDTALVLRRGDAVRELPLDEFYLGYGKNARQPGEFLEQIRVPLPGQNARIASYKVSKRFDQDISAVCLACRLTLEGSRVAEVRIAFGGMAAVPARAKNAEQLLTGGEWNEQTVAEAMSALAADFKPITDMRASAAYRMQVARNLLYRFYLESVGTAEPRVYDYGRQG